MRILLLLLLALLAPPTAAEPPEAEAPAEAWRAEVATALERAKLRPRYAANESLAKILRELAGRAGVPIELDPGSVEALEARRILRGVTSDGPISVAETLTRLLLSHAVVWEIRWGGVLVATTERMGKIPEALLPRIVPSAPGPERELRRKLESRRVTARYRLVPLGRILESVGRQGDVKVRPEHGVPEAALGLRIDLELRNRRLDHALAAILLPRGLAVAVKGDVLVVSPAAERR